MRIDLRSDTVTRPTPAMLKAMTLAEVGDDVLGDDPTVLRLQDEVARLLGKEAACFVPTGTMANLTAIRAQTEPGDELILHEESHVYFYETGGFAGACGCSTRLIRGDRGLFEAADLDSMVRGKSVSYPASRLVVIENTHNRGGGTIWGLDRINRVTSRARAHSLRCHLDGARLWNASAATGIDVAAFAAPFDTVSCCFSKGLGTPAGSAVAGTRDTIARVNRFRKMFGGTMRQSGILAAAALHALANHRDRLADDHANARRLADRLADAPGLAVDPAACETNMVMIDLADDLGTPHDFCARLAAQGVLVLPNGPRRVRAVTHLDVSSDMIDHVADIIRAAARDAAGA